MSGEACVPPWDLVRIDPGRRDDLHDAVGGHAGCPLALGEQEVMEVAHQPIATSPDAALVAGGEHEPLVPVVDAP